MSSYLSATHFTYLFPHRTISATGDVTASQFTLMVNRFAADVNRFMDETADICTVADASTESNLIAGIISTLIEETLVYKEMAQNIAPQNRVEMKAPSIFDDRHAEMRQALAREKREEKPAAINYNMYTGRVRKWYP